MSETKLQKLQPIKWHGGKSYLAKRLIALMPEHTHYAEPFAGGLSVLLRKSCEGISETVNDLNSELSNFWRVLADPQLFHRFYRIVEAIPLSQQLFDCVDASGVLWMSDHRKISRAIKFFVRARQSRQGLMRDYTTPTRRTRRGMNEQVSAWLTAVDGLPDVHRRLRRVEIRNMPAVEFIRKYDHAGALFYCDPPYLHQTRSSIDEYACEMTEEQHEELLDRLPCINGKFLLSGYPSEMYDDWAGRHGYRCERFEIDNKASSAKQKPVKTECVWMNY